MHNGMFLRRTLVMGMALIGILALMVSVADAATLPSSEMGVPLVIAAGNNQGQGVNQGPTNRNPNHSQPPGPGNNVPEAPYAAIFPMIIGGATVVVYWRRRHQHA